MDELREALQARDAAFIKGSDAPMPIGVGAWEGITKAEILEKILRDESRGIRIIPPPGYGHKMQVIRSTSLDFVEAK